ncbi:unnamed protein product [Adineta steineri]|uniref:Uncharacterized protein n=1 Tax=Adineta steineri TaxID=433720 RepID=A0A814MLM6_9BILA|nr:unnamed protein product [Adineta steineri]CAF1126513.1 unnamed protein product [Adineta steineri]CAF4058184.1 unnamed protein product [Adineta steineri]
MPAEVTSLNIIFEILLVLVVVTCLFVVHVVVNNSASSRQGGTVSNRPLLCEGFDGFSDSSKTTGMYDFSIETARLSL